MRDKATSFLQDWSGAQKKGDSVGPAPAGVDLPAVELHLPGEKSALPLAFLARNQSALPRVRIVRSVAAIPPVSSRAWDRWIDALKRIAFPNPTDRLEQKHDSLEKKMDVSFADVRKQLGGLSLSVGMGLEAYALDKIPRLLEMHCGFKTETVFPETFTDGGRTEEIDDTLPIPGCDELAGFRSWTRSPGFPPYLSVEPDVVFVSHAAVERGRARFVPSAGARTRAGLQRRMQTPGSANSPGGREPIPRRDPRRRHAPARHLHDHDL